MDYVVEGTPETCLAKVEAYFAGQWPYAGSYRRAGGNTVRFIEAEPASLIDSAGGWVVLLGLTVVTFGAFLPIYFLYWLVFRSNPTTKGAQVVASPEAPGMTRLQTTASRENYAQELDAWVQAELVENRAAALAEGPPAELGSADAPRAGDPGGTGAADRIRELAELRDSGLITPEEFEAKKREILDRM